MNNQVNPKKTIDNFQSSVDDLRLVFETRSSGFLRFL